MRAAALQYCSENKLNYSESNIIVAHLGGGITLSLHSGGRIIDMISDDEGAFSPERAGIIPSFKLARVAFEEGMTYEKLMRRLQREGGLMSHFGTTDARLVLKMAEDGDAYAQLVIEAMALGVARSIAKLAVVVDGNIDAIILTGGLSYSESLTAMIIKRVSFISKVSVMPGEKEMEALANGAYRVLLNKEEANEYSI